MITNLKFSESLQSQSNPATKREQEIDYFYQKKLEFGWLNDLFKSTANCMNTSTLHILFHLTSMNSVIYNQ